MGSSEVGSSHYPVDSEENNESDYEGSEMFANLNKYKNSIQNILSRKPSSNKPISTVDSPKPPSEDNSDIYFWDTDEYNHDSNPDMDVVNADGGDLFSHPFIIYVPVLSIALFFFICSCSASCYIWHHFK